MVRLATNGKRSLEDFLSERRSALEFVLGERSFEELRDSRRLTQVLANLKQAFGGFVDLGIIEENGVQVSYAGPYELQGRDYREHNWFHEVSIRGYHVSDVFMGYRSIPHFVIAVRQTLESGECRYGDVLESVPLSAQFYGSSAELVEIVDESGTPLILTTAEIERSPFTIVLLSPQSAIYAGLLTLRRDLLLLLSISVLLILGVVIWGSHHMVNRRRESDLKRAAAYHQMEYTNKMAALGRLSAGVAHEINNPLSIITEKAGLLNDLLMLKEELPPRQKLIDLGNSVLNSAERCGTITHRLLGFAKHMEVQRETIDLDQLLREVLGFLEKEASYRSISVEFNYSSEEPPTVVSDRGQLQQVFLNIINNAFAAVDDGGRISIELGRTDDGFADVKIGDDGIGIAEEHLQHIFDPFFTTKKSGGTGLGLSITYGIVQKLGGQISVQSKLGEGTTLTVRLPNGQSLK
jgi:signal transduction histidine kinase